MVSKKLSILLLIMGVVIIPGCSVGLITMSNADKRLESLPHRDVSEMPVEITRDKEDPNKANLKLINNSTIELPNPSRMKYESFYFDLIRLVAVTGQLPNGEKYTTFLDTAYSDYVLVNSLVVLENELAIYPLGISNWFPSYMGLCELPSLQMGQAIIKNPPCMYIQQQWEVKLLGLPIWQQKGFLLGLGILKDFSYIEFNNVKKEVEFSATKIFEPDNPDIWDGYPLEIRDRRLMVKIPIDGKTLHLMFDTCGRYGMVARSDIWEQLPPKVRSGKIRDSRFQTGFFGELPCKRTKVKKLAIGNIKVKNAEIIILPEDSLYGGNYISMEFFKNTTVVLDFKNRLLWIKKMPPYNNRVACE